VDVIIVVHTEFGFVNNREVVPDKRATSGVSEGVPNLIKIADKYNAKITIAVMPEVMVYFPKGIEHEIGLHVYPGWEEFRRGGHSFQMGDRYLRDVDPVAWRKKISVIFQDYVHYYLSAAENIWVGDIEQEQDPNHITAAADRSGADPVIRSLPDGYHTKLGHWFSDGQELSEGEWQKIALARAFFRDSGIVILDEPTSSLDPLAEAELFRNFRNLLEGRSAVIISHRFSTVQMADRIYLLDKGRIIEQGSHEELLRQNGRYSFLFRTQAEHYQENPA